MLFSLIALRHYVAIFAFCLSAFSLPFVLTYINRASIILWSLAVMGALLLKPRITWRPDWAMLAFVIWGALSALWQYEHGLALPQAVQLLGLVLGGEWLLATGGTLDVRDCVFIKRALLGGLALGVSAILLDWISGCALLSPIYALRGKPSMFSCWMPYLKTGPTVLTLIVPILWGWYKPVALVFTLLLALLAILVDSHATMLALAVAMCILMLCRFLAVRKVAVLMASTLTLAVVLMPLVVKLLPDSYQVAVRAAYLPNSARHRLVIWQFSTDLIAQHPLFGWGLNNARAVPGGKDLADVWSRDSDGNIVAYPQPRMPLHPHNIALQIWLETGLVGVMLAVLALWRITLRLSRSSGASGLAGLGAATAVGFVSFGAWQAWWLASLWLFSFFGQVILYNRHQSSSTGMSSQAWRKLTD